MEECKIIEPLVLVVKQVLKVYDLNSGRSKGLSSYGLFLMIVGFLQYKKFYDIANGAAHVVTINNVGITLGELLLSFLSYFSSEFDCTKYMIACRLPNKY